MRRNWRSRWSWPRSVGMVAFCVFVVLVQGTHRMSWARLLIEGFVGALIFCVGYLITSTIQDRREKQ
jgi:hypothetical protein